MHALILFVVFRILAPFTLCREAKSFGLKYDPQSVGQRREEGEMVH